MSKWIGSFLLVCMVVVFAQQPLVGQQKKDEPRLARVWVVTPKLGEVKVFEAALKEHFEWRRENEDPWKWNTYRQVTGTIDGTVHIRSVGHTFADFDAYSESEFAAKAGEHFRLHVMPHVAKLSAHLRRYDEKMSYDTDEERDDLVYWVTRFEIRPGHSGAFRKAVLAIGAKVEETGRREVHWWSWAMNGDRLSKVILVKPEKNWAGHAPDEISVWDTLRETLGEDQVKAMFEELYSHVDNISADVFVKMKDLSVK